MRRVKKILRETRSRMGEQISEKFWMAGRMWQGCPLNLMFFSILITDLEEEMGKMRWGETRAWDEKYTHWPMQMIVLMTEEEGEMRSMIEKLRYYLDKKTWN